MFTLEKGQGLLVVLTLAWSVFVPSGAAQAISLGDVTVASTIEDSSGVQTATVVSAVSGETLRDLGKLLNFDSELVAAMNGLQPGDSLKQGQVIVFPGEATITHIVQPGDTLSELAKTYDAQVERIISDNDLADANLLLVGQELAIPAPRLASVFAATKQIRSRGTAGTVKVMSGEAVEAAEAVEPAESVEAAEAQASRVNEDLASGDEDGKLSQLRWPLAGTISSPFGQREQRFHEGLDIVAPEGDAFRAALAGRVVFSGARGTYGNAVILWHGNGLRTLYAHASRLLVEQGAWVNQGDAVGEVGSTGHSTGPHLHFELLLYGTPLDPSKYLPYN
ncbi:MAG: peptidoglycan DD-metalloendopeptidase family protein [Carboxydocellales bacterium]